MHYSKAGIESLLKGTDVTINGTEPHDISVHHSDFFNRVLKEGSLGFGESYVEGWWDCKELDVLFYKLFIGGIEKKIKINWQLVFLFVKAKFLNLQSRSRAQKAIAHHYDIGNSLYEKMLDPLMMYSCGYWKNASNLKQAQEQKLKLICEKLHLKPGQKVLDIGCGWGGFAYYAAKNYGVSVIGITISREQKNVAMERCHDLKVEIRFQDYRDIDEKFDRIVSIGMLEHVGYKNYRKFINIICNNLTAEGICLLHFISSNDTNLSTDPWIHKYIFPNGAIPSMLQIGKAIEGKLIIEDCHNIGSHYDYTLMSWKENFKNSWETLSSDYDISFYRMWNYYLSCSAASFRSRRLNLWQLVLTKPSFCGSYESIRF